MEKKKKFHNNKKISFKSGDLFVTALNIIPILTEELNFLMIVIN